MVLVKAKRDEILGPLSAVSGIIERRHTLPILSNVLIDRNADALSFLATDRIRSVCRRRLRRRGARSPSEPASW
jgi:DNA polymerase-3 subunit beta